MVSRPGYYNGPYDYWYFPPSWAELPVEIWTYNLGPNKLMRRLRLEDGIVVEVETLGHGYNEFD